MKISQWFTPKRTVVLSICVVVLVFIFVLLPLIFGSFVKTISEKVASDKLDTHVVIGGMYIQPLVGRVGIESLHIENPKGFGAGDALSVGSVSAEMSPFALFHEKIEVDEVVVSGVFVNFIQSNGFSNLDKLQSNMRKGDNKKSSGGGVAIKKLVIEGTSVRLHLPSPIDKSMTIDLPDMTLSNVGSGGGVDIAQVIGLMIGRMIPSINGQILSETRAAAAKTGKKDIRKIEKGLEGIFKK